jgi:hypothetical protein
VLANFNRVRIITNDALTIAKTLENSTVCEINFKELKIRKRYLIAMQPPLHCACIRCVSVVCCDTPPFVRIWQGSVPDVDLS